jgi:hypothetical protein
MSKPLVASALVAGFIAASVSGTGLPDVHSMKTKGLARAVLKTEIEVAPPSSPESDDADRADITALVATVNEMERDGWELIAIDPSPRNKNSINRSGPFPRSVYTFRRSH